MNARLAFDLVYNPVETVPADGPRKGMAIITGVEMFVQQGAPVRNMDGKPAPVAEMQHVVVSELKSMRSHRAEGRATGASCSG